MWVYPAPPARARTPSETATEPVGIAREGNLFDFVSNEAVLVGNGWHYYNVIL